MGKIKLSFVCSVCLLLLAATNGWAMCGQGGTTTITNLPSLGGSFYQATGLNATGQVSGFSTTTGDLAEHAFLFGGGVTLDLGTLGGGSSEAYGLNDFGVVVGKSENINGDIHAAIFNGVTSIDLGTLGGFSSEALAINNNGVVTGNSDSTNDESHAFIYFAGTMADLGTLGQFFSSSAGINSLGTVVGDSERLDFADHGYLFAGGMVDLGDLGGGYSSARAINDLGVVVGEAAKTNGDTHAFVYSGGLMTDLGTFGGTYSTAAMINNSNQVIGVASTAGDAQYHGFIFKGVMTDLGTLGGNYSTPHALNNLGQVVGDSADTTGASKAFIWQNGVMTDLNSLISTNSGWVLTGAQFINDAGRIVGTGTYYQADQTYVLDFKLTSSNTPPVAVAGPDQTVECQTTVALNGSGSSSSEGGALRYEWSEGGIVVGTNVTVSFGLDLGDHTITLKVTDQCDASGQTNVVIHVVDTTAPTISCPSPATASADANCQAPVPNFVSGAVASDNCTPANQLILSQNPAAGTLLGLGQYPVTVTATDSQGNHASCSTTFSVVDTTAPAIISGPTLGNVPALTNCQASVPNVLSSIVAADNCTPANLLHLSQNPAAGTKVGLGAHTIIVTVTDASSNSVSGSLTFNAVDTIPPVIINPPTNITVAVTTNCQAAVPNIVNGLIATDNCGTTNNLFKSQTPAAGTLLGVGSYTITVTVSDASSNSTSRAVSLNVIDNTRPTIVSVPAPITVSADANCSGTIPDVLSSVVAFDNCTPANQLVITQNPAAGTNTGLGQHSIVITVKDASNNLATNIVSFTVIDSTAPVIVSLPAPITVASDTNCSGTVPNVVANVVAADNCTPANQLVITQSPVAGTSLGIGQYSVTITVTDASGNSTTASVSFKVVDTTAPVIVSVGNAITVAADANCQAAVPNILSHVVAADNCTPANQLVITQSPAAGTILGHGQYTITVTVKDAAGNTSTGTIPFTVADQTAPVIHSLTASPNNLGSANKQIVPVTVSAVVTDNCDSAPVTKIISITANETVAAGDIQITGNLTAKLVANRDPAGSGRIYTITVQSTDNSGNSSTGTVTVTVPQGKKK
jgi:probable HAF family extracellular repeat protein